MCSIINQIKFYKKVNHYLLIKNVQTTNVLYLTQVITFFILKFFFNFDWLSCYSLLKVESLYFSSVKYYQIHKIFKILFLLSFKYEIIW